MSVQNNKNYSELTFGQKAFDRGLKAFAITLLVAAIIVCIVASIKANNDGGPIHSGTRYVIDGKYWDRWDGRWYDYGHWETFPIGDPTYVTKLWVAIGTGVTSFVLSFAVIAAFTRRDYPMDLNNQEIETLRQGNFSKVRSLLYHLNKRVASLENAVREGRLEPSHVAFFDDVGLKLHLKLLEIETFKQKAPVQRTVYVPNVTSASSTLQKSEHDVAERDAEAAKGEYDTANAQYQEQLSQLKKDLRVLEQLWSDGQYIFRSNELI